MRELTKALARAHQDPHDLDALDRLARLLRRHGFPRETDVKRGESGEPVWKTKNGRSMYLWEMEEDHLRNSIRMVERRMAKRMGGNMRLVLRELKKDTTYQALKEERVRRVRLESGRPAEGRSDTCQVQEEL